MTTDIARAVSICDSNGYTCDGSIRPSHHEMWTPGPLPWMKTTRPPTSAMVSDAMKRIQALTRVTGFWKGYQGQAAVGRVGWMELDGFCY